MVCELLPTVTTVLHYAYVALICCGISQRRNHTTAPLLLTVVTYHTYKVAMVCELLPTGTTVLHYHASLTYAAE